MSVSPDSGAKTLDGSLFYDEGLYGRANRAPTPHEVPHFGIGSSIKQQQGQSPLDPQWEDETPSIRKIPVISIPSATLGSPRQYPPHPGWSLIGRRRGGGPPSLVDFVPQTPSDGGGWW